MLTTIVSATERFDAGSLALCIATELCSLGRAALVIDADTAAGDESSLAERLGELQHRSYEPHVRGLPTLLASRQPVSEQSISEHVYVLEDTDPGLWMLFGPRHSAGRRHVHDWLSGRLAVLRRLDSGRAVLLAASSSNLADGTTTLCTEADVVVLLDSGEHLADLSAAAQRCFAGSADPRPPLQRIVMVADDSPLHDGEILRTVKCDAVVRLAAWQDARTLRAAAQHRRRMPDGVRVVVQGLAAREGGAGRDGSSG